MAEECKIILVLLYKYAVSPTQLRLFLLPSRELLRHSHSLQQAVWARDPRRAAVATVPLLTSFWSLWPQQHVCKQCSVRCYKICRELCCPRGKARHSIGRRKGPLPALLLGPFDCCIALSTAWSVYLGPRLLLPCLLPITASFLWFEYGAVHQRIFETDLLYPLSTPLHGSQDHLCLKV